MRMVKASTLNPGDVVRCNWNDGYADATVIKKEGDLITIFRPYVSTPDFIYSSGTIIPLIGFEQTDLHPDREIELLKTNKL